MFPHLQYAIRTHLDPIGKGAFTNLAKYVNQTHLQEALKGSPQALSSLPVSFLPLLIGLILASLVPLALSSMRGRLAVPIVVGEIVAGMIVGRSGLGCAAAPVGKKLGIIDESVNAGIVLVAIVTVTTPCSPRRGRKRRVSWSPIKS